MSGNGKHFIWQHYLTAYQVCWKEDGIDSMDRYVRGNENSPTGQMLRLGDTFESNSTNPEEIAIKKDLLQKLSEETKEILRLIFNGPKEVLDAFCTMKYNLISKPRIKDYLVINAGWEPQEVERCFEELEELARDIY